MPTARELLIELRQRREATQAELNRIIFTISVLERVETDLGSAQFPANFLIDPPEQRGSADRQVETKVATPAEIVHRVTELLQQRGEPMTRGQIARALEEQGLKLPGRDVYKNIGTILWRNQDRFVNLSKLGYWLANVPIPGVYARHDADD